MTIVEHCTRDGKETLAIRTGMTSRAFAQSKLPQEQTVPGFILDPAGGITPWNADGTFCEGSGPDERMTVHGPAFSGRTLLEAFSDTREAAWKQLYQSILLIHKSVVAGLVPAEQLAAIAGAGPESILCDDEGRVLVLPSELYTRSLGNHGERAAFENRFRWVHPDYLTITPSRAFAFLAGTAAYRIAAGTSPFEQAIEMGSNTPSESFIFAEDTARNIRHSIFEPLELAVWNVRPAAAACINALVSTELATSADTLIAFGPDFSAIIDPQKEGTEESAEHRAARDGAKKRRDGLIKRERFIRKYRRAFGIGAMIAIAVGVVVGVYVSDMKGKPSTAGLTPDEVVLGFYAGIANLDQEIPQSYSVKGVKNEYTDLITNLYVTSRVRQSYERDTGIMSPAQLFAAGGNIGKMTVYGMTGLTITRTSLTATEAEYDVSLYLWIPTSENQTPPDTSSTEVPVQLSIYRYGDTVRLAYAKDRWKIAEFKPKGAELVEGDAQKILAEIASSAAMSQAWAPAAEDIEKAKKEMIPQEFPAEQTQ
jgi:hypothetical protein